MVRSAHQSPPFSPNKCRIRSASSNRGDGGDLFCLRPRFGPSIRGSFRCGSRRGPLIGFASGRWDDQHRALWFPKFRQIFFSNGSRSTPQPRSERGRSFCRVPETKMERNFWPLWVVELEIGVDGEEQIHRKNHRARCHPLPGVWPKRQFLKTERRWISAAECRVGAKKGSRGDKFERGRAKEKIDSLPKNRAASRDKTKLERHRRKFRTTPSS